MRSKWLPQPVVASLIAGLLCCLLCAGQKGGGSTTTATSAATSFRGGATGCSGLALGNILSIVNSGTLSVSGGAQEAVLLAESVDGVFSAETLHATAIGQGNVVASESSAANWITGTPSGAKGNFGVAALRTARSGATSTTSIMATAGT